MSDEPTLIEPLQANEKPVVLSSDSAATKITASINIAVAGFGSLVGSTWGDFELGEILGRGGMGAVYRARQASLDRAVAIKILPPELAERSELRERFLREARAIAQVTSPHIVQIFHAGTHLGWHFYAMELLDGADLGRRLRDGWHPTVAEARALILQAARGLAAAARFGIVHRDIKPANMLFGTDGTLKLTDFGLVRRAGDEQLTTDGQIMGTASYLSPEQALGKPCDARSDLYSLGIVFYELLAGAPPFASDSITGVVYQHIHETAVPVTQANPDVDHGTAAVVAALLAKDPAARYQTAADLLTDLEALSAGRSTRVFRAKRHRPVWIVPASIAVVVLALGAGWWWQRSAAVAATAAAQAEAEAKHAGQALAAAQAAAQQAREAQARIEQERQAREAARRDAYGRFADLEVGEFRLRLRELPPGQARIGSPPDEEGRSRDEIQAGLHITTRQWIGATEITQAQWRAVMGVLPEQAHSGDNLPITGIDRTQIASFCARLTQLAPGLDIRLPSEAEWERAARAGSAGAWSGDRPLATQAWYAANAGKRPHPVGSFPPNAWGLFDVHGNVAEWTGDIYRPREATVLTDPQPVSGDGKAVVKGGAYDDDPEDCRLAYRETARAASKRLGFRVLATQLPPELR